MESFVLLKYFVLFFLWEKSGKKNTDSSNIWNNKHKKIYNIKNERKISAKIIVERFEIMMKVKKIQNKIKKNSNKIVAWILIIATLLTTIISAIATIV